MGGGNTSEEIGGMVGGGAGGGVNYLRAHIHLRFRHAHHETKDWLPPDYGLGADGVGGGSGGCGLGEAIINYENNIILCVLEVYSFLLSLFYMLPN